MDWLRRIGRLRSPGDTTLEERAPAFVERATPGVAALLEGVDDDGSHTVLDLGPAADSSLRVYSRFARRIRFADVLTGTASPTERATALDTLPTHPEQPYDLVFAWNTLDRLAPEERPRLIERLTSLTGPDARLFVVVATAPGQATGHPFRFALQDVDRMSFETTAARPAWTPLLPAEVERLLQPFHVVRAFTTKVGLREYVAVRQGS